MKTYSSLKSFSKNLSHQFKPVLTIGNFDGFHLGHLALCNNTKKLATQYGTPWGILSFNPHPESFFKQIQKPSLISPSSKVSALEAIGADFFINQEFSEAFSKKTPQEFIQHLISETGEVAGLVIGFDFQFGQARAGKKQDLQKAFDEKNLPLVEVSPIKYQGRPISSTRLREEIQKIGNFEDITAMLGRPYSVTGKVVHGKKVGRSLGFPTANIHASEETFPLEGVYTGFCTTQTCDPIRKPKSLTPMLANIGKAPTIMTSREKKLEVHLLGVTLEADALYHQDIRVFFCHRLRSEQKFADVDQLKEQINLDKQMAAARLAKASSYWKPL